MTKASVQQDLHGKYVVQDEEEKVYYVFAVGGYQCRLPSTAVEDVNERVELMEEAKNSDRSRKFTQDNIEEWKKAWVHNHIKAAPPKKHHDEDFNRLFKAMWKEVMKVEPCGLEHETVTVEHFIWATSKFRISTSKPGFEGKQKKWEARIVPPETTGKKKRRKKRGTDLEAEGRAVAGERIAWIQQTMRFQKGESVTEPGEFEAHALRFYKGIFEGEGLRSTKGESIKPFSSLTEKERPKLAGTTLEAIAQQTEKELRKKGMEVTVDVKEA